GGQPLLLIDLAVPRDIHPECREVAGVSLYDMDDLQAVVERNLSVREAEARRAEAILGAERARFERWLGAQEATPTIAALRERAREVVERVLAENERRWESASDGDRIRALASAVASRLLHEPTVRLKRIGDGEDAYRHIAALRSLFGLDAGAEPLAESDAEVRELRRPGQRRERS